MIFLLVEDDPNDALLFRRALRREKLGCVLHIAQDGQEGVDWLSGVNEFADRSRFPLPDVVISDLKMPRMNGFELLQWIRAQPALQALPFVILTSSGQQSDRNHAIELGVKEYFQKTPRFEDIIAHLRNLTASVLAEHR